MTNEIDKILSNEIYKQQVWIEMLLNVCVCVRGCGYMTLMRANGQSHQSEENCLHSSNCGKDMCDMCRRFYKCVYIHIYIRI